jgi:hypothetical protein
MASIDETFVYFIKIDYFNDWWNPKLMQSKWNYGPIIPMYIINIFMDPPIEIINLIIILKIILHNIIFVKIIIVRPKSQNWYPKLNVPSFWNNSTICIIILDPKVPQRQYCNVFSPLTPCNTYYIRLVYGIVL